ncbi:MAG: hypothetical protein JSS32_04495 [Verrucomicrobia bacterium]|nr:hypothetical protein [Verrucomicrobiota bacterium]
MQPATPRSDLRNHADLDVKFVMVETFTDQAKFDANKDKVAAAFRCTIDQLAIYYAQFKTIVENYKIVNDRLPKLKEAKDRQFREFWDKFWENRPSPEEGAQLDKDQAALDAAIKYASDQIDAWHKSEQMFYTEVAKAVMAQYGNISTVDNVADWKAHIVKLVV